MTADPDNPEVLTSVPSEIEAAAIVTALDSLGIQASATGGYTAGFRAEAPGEVAVTVRRADLDRARQALTKIKHQQSDVDWSNIDVGQPDDS